MAGVPAALNPSKSANEIPNASEQAVVSAQTSPPWQVVSAIYLLGAELGLAVVRSILMKDWSRPIPATLGVLVLAAVCSLWLYGLWASAQLAALVHRDFWHRWLRFRVSRRHSPE